MARRSDKTMSGSAAAKVTQRVYFDPLPGETMALRIFGATTHLPLARADDERDALRIAEERGWTVVPSPFA